MRRLYPLVLAALLVLAIGIWSPISRAGEKIAAKLMLYVHIAQLYSQEPDRRLMLPLPGVRKDKIANTWHAPRSGGRQHEGQDIFAERGTPIYSATRGYVYNIGENPLGGQTVSVVGAGGRVYYYAHLDSYSPYLEEGDYVTTQTVLGYVGTSGNALGTPPHLHFGVYTLSGPINSLPLLSERPGQRAKGEEQSAKAPIAKRN